MLSESESHVRELIEDRLAANAKEEILLYHYSVERKLKAAELFFQNVIDILPTFFQSATATSGSVEVPPGLLDLESTINNISAYIDAFFMSAKSTLDTFAHELRSLYGFSNHIGDLYFENALDLLRKHHFSTELNLYLISCNIRDSSWFQELNSYRRASAHESIIPIRPSIDIDVLDGQLTWKDPILKLPLNPAQKPPDFNGKNFKTIGKLIKDKLQKLIIDSYDKILIDIHSNRTRIVL